MRSEMLNHLVIPGRKVELLRLSNTAHQTNLFGADIQQQLDFLDPLLQLAAVILWSIYEEFTQYYTPCVERPAKPIRLMVELRLLKYIENLSDEKEVVQFKRNLHYQAFCGQPEFSLDLPYDSTELVHFRKRIGKESFEKIFQVSVRVHGKTAFEETVNSDTIVQEKAGTYSTDAKLANKTINRLNKLAKRNGIQQRRTSTKEVKNLRLAIRHFRYIERRAKAKKALKRLCTIAGILVRELRRTLPKCRLFDQHQKEFLFYERVLEQQPKDKNKIYLLHEPDVNYIGKGKDHKQYGYGNKVSVASTTKTNIVVGVVSHERNIHDNHTLPEVLSHIENSRGKVAKQVVCDRRKKTFSVLTT